MYEGVHGTPSPAIETDRDGNIYLIHSDSHPLPGGGYSNDAYFLRFLVANNYANPTIMTLPDGAAQKFTAVIDESRGRMYYAATNFVATPPSYATVWFFSIRSGRHRLFENPSDTGGGGRAGAAERGGPSVNDAHYPHLYLDEHNHLYAAWTNAILKYRNPVPPEIGLQVHSDNYYSIHSCALVMARRHWENLNGTPITLPVVADHRNNGLTHEVNVDRGGRTRCVHLALEHDRQAGQSAFLVSREQLRRSPADALCPIRHRDRPP